MRNNLPPTLLLLAATVLVPLGAMSMQHCPEGRIAREGGSCAGDEAADANSRRNLIMQKLSLLQAYLNSDSIVRVRDAGDMKAATLVREAESHLAEAMRLLDADKLSEAGAELDEGLRSASMASSRAAKPKRSAQQERGQYEKLHGQIRSYLDAVAAAMREGGPKGPSDKTVARIDGLVSEAERLAAAGQHGNANDLLADAYQMTVTLISRLRKGTTLVSTLNFATPADELEYERRRNGSYEMLVTILLEERQGDSKPLRQLADRYVAESRELREQAERHAEAGEYGKAILTMEEATARLVRILRAGGLPVPQ